MTPLTIFTQPCLPEVIAGQGLPPPPVFPGVDTWQPGEALLRPGVAFVPNFVSHPS
jgi:hypothetical protein